MKTLALAAFGEMAVQDRPTPDCGPGEILIRVVATGICGSDLHGVTGENGRRHIGQVMGHETVGRVAAVGVGVGGDIQVGQVVTVNPVLSCQDCDRCRSGRDYTCLNRRVIGVDPTIVSAFAEFLVAPERNVVVLPDEMPIEYGALIEPLAVAFHAARRGHCDDRDRVLVVGGGPIGQSAVLASRRLGATKIVVSEPDARRRELCASLGVAVVDPTRGEVAAQVSEALGGPATLALDAVGASQTIADSLAATEPGANVVLVGMQSPQVTIPAYAVSTEERTVVGSFCYSAEDFRAAAAWAGTAPPELAGLIEQRVGLTDAPDAFTRLTTGQIVAGKVLVLFDSIATDDVAADDTATDAEAVTTAAGVNS